MTTILPFKLLVPFSQYMMSLGITVQHDDTKLYWETDAGTATISARGANRLVGNAEASPSILAFYQSHKQNAA